MKRLLVFCACFSALFWTLGGCYSTTRPDNTGAAAADNGTFAAADAEAGADHAASPVEDSAETQPGSDSPLTDDELAWAGALVSRLEAASDDEERRALLDRLISLGPRYLEFLRSVESEAVTLDLLFVIRRIEEQGGVAPSDAAIDRPTRAGGAVDGLGDLPSYLDQPGEYDREQVEIFMAHRLAQAREKLADSDFEQAEQIARAALVLMPDSRYRPEFEEVILQAQGQGQTELLVAGNMSLEPVHLHYAARERSAGFAEALSIRCFLRNVSAESLILKLSDGADKGSIVELTVVYEQLDYQGNVLSSQGNVVLPVATTESTTLAPNESYELAVPLAGLSSLDADAPQKYALGRLAISARLRVYGAARGDGRALALRPISFSEKQAWVYPAGFDLEDAQSRPLSALAEAIGDNRPQDVLMTATLVDAKRLREAGDLLLGDDLNTCALGLQRARLRAMALLLNKGSGWDAAKWRDWWRENRLKY